MLKALSFFFFGVMLFAGQSLASQSYFPSAQGTWDTISALNAGFCPSEWDSVEAYLQRSNTKGFMILKSGRIVYESYFDGYRADSAWYWASAGKTLVAYLVGRAQEDGRLDIQDPSATYLGSGWTSLPPNKEQLITVEDQLKMTTGLDYTVPDLDCTADTCLLYRADAGTQWYYHNAPYLLLHDVLEQAEGLSMNQLTRPEINQIGMNGLWIGTLFFSSTRNMARFGHLLLNEGQWNGQRLLSDTAYFRAMVRPSQGLNPAYGYLTWLNGQNSFMRPGFASSFPGYAIPAAPADLYLAAGANEQRIYVWPSQDIVVVRQGDAAGGFNAALSAFDQELWQRLMPLFCGALHQPERATKKIGLYPNPAKEWVQLDESWSEQTLIYNALGKRVLARVNRGRVDLTALPAGVYLVLDRANGRQERLLVR